jgi:hypothetical protein
MSWYQCPSCFAVLRHPRPTFCRRCGGVSLVLQVKRASLVECWSCHYAIPASARFCPHCRKAHGDALAPPRAQGQVMQASPARPQLPAGAPIARRPHFSPRPRAAWRPFALALTVFLLPFVLLLLYMGYRDWVVIAGIAAVALLARKIK